MSGKVIAVANMKGGVGKTTTIVGLAEAIGAAGYGSVLVIDLDPQANASVCLAGDKKLDHLIENGRTIDAYLDDNLLRGQKRDFLKCIITHVSNVTHEGAQLPISLLASSPHLRFLERELVSELTDQGYGLDAIVSHVHRSMKRNLERVAPKFKYVLIDCPPGLSALTEACIRLADLVIVPTIPDFLSTYGLDSFSKNLWMNAGRGRAHQSPKEKPWVLVTRKRHTKEHNETTKKLRDASRLDPPPFRIFDVEVKETTDISTALNKLDGSPTFTSKWKAEVVSIFARLAFETREALNGSRS